MEILASKLKAAKISSCFSKCWPNSCCLTFVCAKLLYKKERGEMCLEAQRWLHAEENTWLLPAWIVSFNTRLDGRAEGIASDMLAGCYMWSKAGQQC